MKILKYFPYRTGRPMDRLGEFPRESMKSLEEQLSKMQNVHADNHVCYLISIESFPVDRVMGVMFSDFKCVLAHDIEEKFW